MYREFTPTFGRWRYRHDGSFVTVKSTIFINFDVVSKRSMTIDYFCFLLTVISHRVIILSACYQGRSQEFDLGGYKWVKETKQPHKNI